MRSKEKALFDKTDRDAQEIAEHINKTCGLMWYDLFLVELGLGKHMTNLRPVGSYALHKLWSNKISIKIDQMTLQDGMEGLRLALQVLCGPHNFGALGAPTTDPPDPIDRSTYPGIEAWVLCSTWRPGRPMADLSTGGHCWPMFVNS